MSTQHTTSALRNPSVNIFQEAPCQDTAQASQNIAAPTFLGFQYLAVDKLTSSQGEQKKKWSLADVWYALFPGHERATYRGLEGDDMTPILVYKLGDCYIVAEDRLLAAARFTGVSFVQAEVWEYPGR